jgi:hypothetical protein
MVLRAPEFPAASVSTVALAVVGFSHVLAATAPHVRNFRDASRAWQECATAARDAQARLLALQASMAKAQATMATMDKFETDTAVGVLLSFRSEVATFIDDLDSAVLAIETARLKVRALRKHRAIIVRMRPDFDEALASFDAGTAEIEKMRATADTLREGTLMGQLDEMLRIATDAASQETLRLAREMAKAKPRPTPAEAVRSLEEIHEFANVHGIKFNG